MRDTILALAQLGFDITTLDIEASKRPFGNWSANEPVVSAGKSKS
jgi:hypothetical protein